MLKGRVATLIGIAVALTVVIVLLALGGASLRWTGFGEKKLWDWLQLLSALAIPVVLAAAGLWFSGQQDRTQRAIEEQRAQDAALQDYLNQMSTLLLEHNLRSSVEAPSEEAVTAQSVARARTLAVLPRLEGRRKYSVVLFLGESQLIQEDSHIVWLVGADLSNLEVESRTNLGWNLSGTVLHGTDLSDADMHNVLLRGAALSNTDLSGADLTKADLSDAILRDTNLSDANLSDATVTEEQLAECKSLERATMPDGSKHP